MANVDCHFYVEIFESEEDKDPIAISNIFKFPDDNTDSQVYTDAMDRYVVGMSEGLGVLPVHYRVFRVRGDGVKKFQYAATIIVDEEEPEDEEVVAVTDSQGEKEPEVVDVEDDKVEEPEQEDVEDESEKTDEQDDAVEDDKEAEDVQEDESEKTDEQDDAVEDDKEAEDVQEDESEKTDEQDDAVEDDKEDGDVQEEDVEAESGDVESDSEEDEEDEWPWLTELEGRTASKKNANKFMLGAIMNYWMRPEVSWDNAEKLAEDILEDPDDLWGTIADKSDADIIEIFTGPPRLHRFLKMMPEMVREVAINVVKEYDGDSRKIWKDQDVSDILQHLHAIGVKKQTSALILWALRESGQIKI